jgi:site-specific recombinase XerD
VIPAKATGYVFRDAGGSGLVETSLAHTHKRVRELLKMPSEFVLHTLRHTFGTRLGEGGADAFTIMRLMGHSSVTTSQRYVHPTPETLELAMRRMEKVGVEVHGVPLEVPIVADRQNPLMQ